MYGRLVSGIACSITLLLHSSLAGSSVRMWTELTQEAIRHRYSAPPVAARHRTFELAADRLQELLAFAPPEGAADSEMRPVLELPLPDGSYGRFRVEESPVMAPGLAARYPEIRTYRGVGLDDPTAVARFDLTLAGFHGMILSAENTVYINPHPGDEDNWYVTFNRRDAVPGPDARFPCLAQGEAAPRATSVPRLATGPRLRTYRTAIAATGEYTQYHGGTRARALSAIVVVVNRLNGIFRRELSVALELVAENDRVIFTDPDSDPYTADDTLPMIGENQATLDSVIGAANYDHGHLFSAFPGGRAAEFGTVCDPSLKAQGVSGLGVPAGEVFVVDLVAHEMGHQLGAAHTYNSTEGTCSRARNEWAAYEPGSGSTIMSYAGICPPENIQEHSDDYFHIVSLDEMSAYLAGRGSTCGSTTETGNRPPRVRAGPDFTIPKETPFSLSGSGSDASPLTFTWEQFDLGPASPPMTDDGQRPLFRSYAPSARRSRTFPPVVDILSGTATLGETLPTTQRRLTFRLTARDGRGGVNDDTMVLHVQGDTGPFRVTEPRGGDRWQAGGLGRVQWDVAGTGSSPVACEEVDILLSNDGGHSFPDMLADSTPNDGSEEVVVPFRPGAQARVKAACSDNVFFAISPSDFSIRGPAECLPGEGTLCLQNRRFWVQVSWRDFEGNTGQARAHGLTPDSGYFTFFDENNAEVFIKVLDACGLARGNYWVFDTHLSNVEYTITVADTQTGQTRTIFNPLGYTAPAVLGTRTIFTECGSGDGRGLPLSELIDTSALPPSANPAVDEVEDASIEGTCTPDSNNICLNNGRFRLHATFRDFQGDSGLATMWPLTADSGYATFFDDSNVELFMKVLDACGLPDRRFWVFVGGLTNVPVELYVEDTATSKVWHQSNPSGTPYATTLDTATFLTDCP